MSALKESTLVCSGSLLELTHCPPKKKNVFLVYVQHSIMASCLMMKMDLSSSTGSCGIYLRTAPHELLRISITVFEDYTFKITLTSPRCYWVISYEEDADIHFSGTGRPESAYFMKAISCLINGAGILRARGLLHRFPLKTELSFACMLCFVSDEI